MCYDCRNWAVGVPRSIEARGPFECPRMLDCNKVCQGLPNCCVNGQCICQKCPAQQIDDHALSAKPNFQLN